MRIIRFKDAAGNISLGRRLDDEKIELLQGDLFGTLKPTGKNPDVSEVLAPLVPTNIFCIGRNYAEHAREGGAEPPERPIVFMKPTSTLLDPGRPIVIPRCSRPEGEVDYEAELAVIIGKAGRDIAEKDALSHVFGYTCANDVSARWWQKNGGGDQWVRGKGFDTFCPLGPTIVTADEIPDPQVLRVRATVNGQLVQDDCTSQMIFSVRRLISDLSRDTTLLPGTVILTGTPSGVGFARKPPLWLKAGDHVAVEIENIGRLENPVRAAGQ